jgi:antitoxin component of RelBE/YafQ-DinJ toxin-antitoxin module
LWQHFLFAHGSRLWQHIAMTKDTIIKLRITQAEKDAWTDQAKREGLTLSQYIRYLVGPIAGTGKT